MQTVFIFLTAICCSVLASPTSAYLVGTGKADITGPAADVNLMGYASPGQLAAGIYTRLYARAFMIADQADPSKRFVFVNMDACMAAQGVTLAVLHKLKEQYKGVYTEQNVALSGIHTHSGPGGYLQYVLYDITSLGFVQQSFDALVDGIVEAIAQAHDSLAPGHLQVTQGELLEANINRSPTAYEANPAEERARFDHDTDKTLTLLKLLDAQGMGVGAVAWYAVHCTSINNTNSLISGDNKGAAAQLFSKWAASEDAASANVSKSIVAAFAQSNVGDTSPNTAGAFCADTGLPCSREHSLCNGRNEQCIGRGPAWKADDHGFLSNEIIAGYQADKASELWKGSADALSGAVESRHAYLDMSSIEVLASNYTRAGRTCKPAMGFSFAAGTTDGPGAFDFKQGDNNGTLFWRLVRSFIHIPTAEQADCHAPKPILLDTGNINIPYAWQPSIVEISVLRAGQLVILCVPGEFTTMAGRRLRQAIYDQVAPVWGDTVTVVIAGLSNTYSGYITTFEEYQVQRFEAAATAYGPHTLDAYVQEFMKLTQAMTEGKATEPGPSPPDLGPKQWSFLPPVVIDSTPSGKGFGSVVADVPPREYKVGDTVTAVFQSACPRNDIRRGGSFLAVERQQGASWDTVFTDNDMSTKQSTEEEDFTQFLDDGASPSDIWPVVAERIWRLPDGRKRALGYVGHWLFYSADGCTGQELTRSFRCLRSYCSYEGEGGQPGTVVLRNFHERQPGLERVHEREQDGLYESVHHRSLRDPYFSCSMQLEEEEKAKGLPSSMFWRVIPITLKGETSCRMPPALPPNPLEAFAGEGQYPNWSPMSMAGAVWAFEGFITDGKNRWSLGPLYSMQSLRLISHFIIREYEVAVDASKPVLFREEDFEDERPRLSNNPADWLEGRDWKGSMTEIFWDDDGQMTALRPRPTTWAPPDASNQLCRLFCYPDEMYSYYPLRLTPAEDPGPPLGKRFEIGGMMRCHQEFRRLILRYGPSGVAESLCLEVFAPENLERQFSGRQRKSLDIRSARSRRFLGMDGGRPETTAADILDHSTPASGAPIAPI
ncbi:hypothetical protein WJX73_002285 [Symbiochloris irregularis]|uniref:ceramidase n=1 Tax=Symbiochloris irregularis TaxID=706552 RepID=A0AAW1NF20_9CHLO